MHHELVHPPSHHSPGFQKLNRYTKEDLNNRLTTKDWNFESDGVQDFWNELENQLIEIVDELVPLTEGHN